MGRKGTRGHFVPKVEKKIRDAAGDGWSYIPKNMRRKQAPDIPELSEVEVMRHFFVCPRKARVWTADSTLKEPVP